MSSFFVTPHKASRLWSFFLNIPPYQRDYVWKKDRFDEFWLPFIEKVRGTDPNAYDSDPEPNEAIRLGAVLLVEAPKNGDGSTMHLDIIDGQQRLTTLFLLGMAIRAIHQKLPEPKKRLKVEMMLTDADSGDLRLIPRRSFDKEALDWMYAHPHASDNDWKVHMMAVGSRIGRRGLTDNGSSVRSMWDMYRMFCLRIQEEARIRPDIVEGLDQFVYRGVFLVPIMSPNEQTALVDFERMNSVGVRLSSMDLLKGAMFAGVNPASYKLIESEFEDIRKTLSEDMHALGAFLRHYVVGGNKDWSVHKPVDEIEALRHLRQVGANGIPESGVAPLFAPGSIKPFLAELKEAAEVTSRFQAKDSLGPSGPSLALVGIKRLRAQKIVLAGVLAARGLPPPLFEEVLSALEDALFVMMVARVQAKQIERFVFTACQAIWSIGSPLGHAEFQRGVVSKAILPNRGDFLSALRQYGIRPYGGADRARYLLEHLSVFVARGGRKGSLADHRPFEKGWEVVLADSRLPDSALFPEVRKDRLGNLVLLEKPPVGSSTGVHDRIQRLSQSASLLNTEWWGAPSRQLAPSLAPPNRLGDWWGKDVQHREDWLIALADQRWVQPYLA